MRIPLALLLTLSSPALAGVEIVDGDTLRIDGDRVRLWGFDAPEKRQKCLTNGREEPIGQEATEALRSLVARGQLQCETKDRDRYGRTVADCSVGGRSIGDAMVWSGWAWALPRYSKDRFLSAQEEAEQAGRGVWAGHANCEAPARFRQQHRR
ncbi:endonuclease YncB(thermonuclease family) [Inquilinus ginsengisoli]|uniref:thermonuclease family protein n=1 Tax=Inquilinus ginsengisoli TaxID=363840 RepID=UPI003D1FF14E